MHSRRRIAAYDLLLNLCGIDSPHVLWGYLNMCANSCCERSVRCCIDA